ncbi:alpha/beta hydrolase [Synechococcus sp. RSCCF101]|uniref:alpha/beta hydrolase n=1 Tax=Synechococcus sp. RSCCF101 TaxID=2511069 RepID=UPI001248F6A6|nr:alpha/beta hydrolase [Synechococcus sp. RSCCF101]QEY33104.1 alpha/beta hydrolase [Synechococcus sp. RSCCF101]
MSIPGRLRIIAMHGWSGDAAGWAPWAEAARQRGWSWSSGERGYGGGAPSMPSWQDSGGEAAGGTRTLVAHSLGWHLVPRSLLESSEQVVLLASFGRFVPEGREGRSLRQALEGMETCLAQGEGEGEAMLQRFLAEAAAPQEASLMPPGPADRPLTEEGRRRLLADLGLLRDCEGVPAGLPVGARILVLEAGEDRIVPPASRQALLAELTAAGHRPERRCLEGVGHALLSPLLLPTVLAWLEQTA